MEHEDYFDAKIADDLKVIHPLPLYALIPIYQIYAGEHTYDFLAQHADMSVGLVRNPAITAMGVGKELRLLWDWQGYEYEESWSEALYELHMFGNDFVLGLRHGWHGTECLYLTTMDLDRTKYFAGPFDCMLINGEQLTRDQIWG